eukprot:scaffold582_cov385-Prasinococcus_capsulatus_cf.AAC.34
MEQQGQVAATFHTGMNMLPVPKMPKRKGLRLPKRDLERSDIVPRMGCSTNGIKFPSTWPDARQCNFLRALPYINGDRLKTHLLRPLYRTWE